MPAKVLCLKVDVYSCLFLFSMVTFHLSVFPQNLDVTGTDHRSRPHGVMVSTLDFESSDPSSSLGGTFHFSFFLFSFILSFFLFFFFPLLLFYICLLLFMPFFSHVDIQIYILRSFLEMRVVNLRKRKKSNDNRIQLFRMFYILL